MNLKASESRPIARALLIAATLATTASALIGCSSPQPRTSDGPSWLAPVVEQQDSGTDQLLIGLDVVDEQVVWASGTAGTFIRTTDGGETWESGSVPGADTLQFRDVHAASADVAYLLSIGSGTASRIFQTVDAGRSWQEQFVSPHEDAFFDCFDFWEDGSGIAFSDAVAGRFPLAVTTDGARWSLRWAPEAQAGEGGFAASGTCLVTLGDSTVLIGTGNAQTARVLRSVNRGQRWDAVRMPIAAGEGAGITTLSFRDDLVGAAMGGDLAQPEAYTRNVAITRDGGRTWQVAEHPTFPGAVYGSSYVPGGGILTAVGPNGASYSLDNAATWSVLDSLNYWSVDFASPNAGWAVGPEGRIARIHFPRARPH